MKNSVQMDQNNRIVYMDFLIIISIYLVIFNHTGIYGFTYFTTAQDTSFYWFYLFASIFSKVAVPIFFMVSGALLLQREEPIKVVLEKRFLKYLFVLIAFSFGYYIYSLGFRITMISFRDFIKQIYAWHIAPGYWYLYAYLAYLLTLPLLRKMVKNMQTFDCVYMIIVYFVMQLLNVVQYLVWGQDIKLNSYFSVFFLSSSVFFPVFGYILDKKVPLKFYNKKIFFGAFAISILVISVCCVLTNYHCNRINQWQESSCQQFFNVFIFIPAGALFFCVKYIFCKIRLTNWIGKFLSGVASCSFGLFLIEHFCRKMTQTVFYRIAAYLPSFSATLVWILFVYAVGVMVIFVLKHIPFIKKML